MENFTPLSALIGGAMIGLSATLLMLLNGRIAGISGIVGGLIGPKRGDAGWRLTFVAGLILAPVVYRVLAGNFPETSFVSLPLLISGGVLVGVGAQLGSGCTSGHGVCGISRLSTRSLMATATYLASGAAMVFAVRHLIGV